ncbi:hypothetical protein DICPUDRAFT_79055 [Dictyostelium purpureum]|uniref:non-specific serine/threonine protein kinase n=1 Tax=Dictyostelium purpureum TaxID=5786 RepID=F0ZLF1_DICPU|nr:uncharacterized protein DICPUDRAFT_79055 [Dictyostelium purpureum]EGC35207.1 hypothetical protein DICPUDRAFT_79055 [Dictyostelium purpureum]|eukprot:XP_003288245.1 hypothetical protein DICPUDRAFT_79055 [Dictyostelium purpureum]
MKEYNNKYYKVKKLSSNLERVVYLYENIQEKKLYICKRIKLFNLETLNDSEIEPEKNFTESVNQELKFLKQYSNKEKYPHLNIIQYIEDFITIKPNKDYDHLSIITEYYENGDLSNSKGFPFYNIVYLLVKILIILDQFKEDKFVHRDIKPENIFYRTLNGPNRITGEPEYEFYLGDLGSSRIILGLTQDGRYTQAGTNEFIAPEVIEGYITPCRYYSLV